MSYTATILEAMRSLEHGMTPGQLYDYLLSMGVSIKRGTVKRLMYRLWERGHLRKSGHIYFFAQRGDSFNHSGGQKGTNLRGINHLKENKKNSQIGAKKGQKNDWKVVNHLSLVRRICAYYINYGGTYSLSELYRHWKKELEGKEVKYRTVQSAVNFLLKKGILKRVRRGHYRLTSVELATEFLSRGTPKGPMTPLTGTIPMPTLKYTTPRIKGVIVPRDIFERVINHPPRIDPLLIVKSPAEGDRARQWQIETENVKVMISERTLKATIYVKGPEWKKDIIDIFGGWILIELQGKKWMTEAAINMKELLHFKTMQAQVGDIKVSVDKSIFGEDYDLEFQGEVQDVNTAILATLIGPAKFTDDITHLKEGLSQLTMSINQIYRHIEQISADVYLMKHTPGIKELQERINEIDKRINVFGEKLTELNRKMEVIAGGIVKVLDQTSPPDMGGGGVEGYA